MVRSSAIETARECNVRNQSRAVRVHRAITLYDIDKSTPGERKPVSIPKGEYTIHRAPENRFGDQPLWVMVVGESTVGVVELVWDQYERNGDISYAGDTDKTKAAQ